MKDRQPVNYIQTLRDQIDAMIRGFVQSLPSLAIALAILLVTWVVAGIAVRIVGRLTQGTHIREDLRQLFATLIRLAVWIIGLLIALTVAIPSFTPGGAFAGLGIGAVAIGFAFQDIFQNFLAGVLIMLREKMRIGDTIECQGITGRIERITLRETHIRQASGELTVVPNAMLFKNPVKILTDGPVRRDEIIVAVTGDNDLTATPAAIRDALQRLDHIDKARPIVVVAQQITATGIDFLVQWWSEAARDARETKSEVVIAVKRALDETKIAAAPASEPPAPAPPRCVEAR
ncbi:mechanosensitive ion channel family protein [Novosphingobium album (ex Liu et al. 2023)]|uniref:Small-conductance mechanosensitive channel n=1 Tax=Novosphingobium album (ex Liu et al. 2023) TaxID=3031130 RepID=A0ABT5WW79_9SPHN|nr:mechanosensitive ion channel domain-containing protein [Novosphingobium album (ex Liu et al. 2023)]MDE8654131.1 mechanosensitive ion channel [Novosphingobium album (ex Liu et al. 2023)]